MVRPVLLFLLLPLTLLFGAEEPIHSFSLGRAGLWISEGLIASTSAGAFHRSGCDGSFNQAHLALDYMYYPWLGGGAEVQITGGQDEAQNIFAYNRYYLRARFFKELKNVVFFAGPRIGMDQGYSDLFSIGDEWSPEESSRACLDLGREARIGAGGEFGTSWRVSNFWNLTAFGVLEWTIPESFYAEAALATAFNLYNAAESLRRLISSLYLFLEFRLVYRLERLEWAPIAGIAFSF